jgi:hypothetical protein
LGLLQVGLLCFNIIHSPGTLNDGTLLNAKVIVSASFITAYSFLFVLSFFWQEFKGLSPFQVQTL